MSNDEKTRLAEENAIARNLLEALQAAARMSELSNSELADLLIQHIWGEMDLLSPQAMLVHTVIQRLQDEGDDDAQNS